MVVALDSGKEPPEYIIHDQVILPLILPSCLEPKGQQSANSTTQGDRTHGSQVNLVSKSGKMCLYIDVDKDGVESRRYRIGGRLSCQIRSAPQ